MRTKSFFIVAFFVCLPFSAFSQWGVKAGIDWGTLAGHTLATYKTGFHVGVTYDAKLSKQFYFQPALLFSHHRFGYDKLESIGMGGGVIDKYLIEIPANISFRPSISPSAKLAIDYGLYVKYGLFGDTKYDYLDGTSVVKSAYDAYNRFDMGINLGAGVEFAKLYVGGAFQFGLTNGEKGFKTLHNKTFRISMGYKF